jgi:hypothetical protein
MVTIVYGSWIYHYILNQCKSPRCIYVFVFFAVCIDNFAFFAVCIDNFAFFAVCIDNFAFFAVCIDINLFSCLFNGR